MLVYQDEHGSIRSSFVQVIRKTKMVGQTWYEVKAKKSVLRTIGYIVPITKPSKKFMDGEWVIGLVRSESLEPLGSRHFSIIQ